MIALGKNRKRPRSTLALCALALTGATLIPAAARAGTFHVYSCSDPQTGVALPTAGWGASGTGPTFNTCASQPISGGLGGETIAEFGGTLATWTFTAPPDTQIANAVAYRSAVASYRTRAYWAAPENHFAPADSFDVCQGTDAMHACVLGDTTAPASCSSPSACYSPADTLQVPSTNLPSSTLSLDVACVAQGCGGSETMHSADITLTQEQSPTATAVGGSLTSESVLEGEPSIALSAKDDGSGLYQVEFLVDGAVVARRSLAQDDSQCREYSTAADGRPVFLSPRPCPTAVSNVSAPLDTSKVSDGLHQLTVAVEDAAGNAVTVLSRTVPFNNKGEYVAQLRQREQSEREAVELATFGPCNATCDPRARLRPISPRLQRGPIHRSFRRSALALEGRLIGFDGKPIAHGLVEAEQTPSYRGAAAHIVGSSRTSAAGVWRIVMPRGPSRRIVVVYRARTKDATPTARLEWREAVAAPVALDAPKAVRPDQAFFFSGTMRGGFLPPGGLLVSLEIKYEGHWREIALLHAGPHGRFRYSYTFANVAPSEYAFRAFVPPSAVYPFSPGASTPVAVKLR